MASEDSQGIQEDGMKDDDDDDYDSEEDDSLQKAKQALTGRGVTLSALMEDGIIQAGVNVLTIDYRGQRFEADLLENGKIRWQGSEDEFSTPSAWATHCKRLVNPIKRSGCGWASVKYKGRKLDTWKTLWSRKHRTNSPYSSSSPHQAAVENMNGMLQSSVFTESSVLTEGNTQKAPLTKLIEEPVNVSESCSPASNGNATSATSKGPNSGVYTQDMQEEALNLSMSGPNAGKTNGSCTDDKSVATENNCTSVPAVRRLSVEYSSLGARSPNHHPNTFVKCEHFATLGRMQPFAVSISTNAMMLMDFHSHLTSSEVVGYLGGQWSLKSQHLRITQAFPCKCRLGDKDKASIIEEEIRQTMTKQGCSLVGWYHSHPYNQPDPTLKDLDSQISYQLQMKGSGGIYLPCLALVISPYDKRATKYESAYEVFWVMPPPEDQPTGYGIPMHMKCTMHQSGSLSEELLSEMNKLADFYRVAPDRIRWREVWSDTTTYIEKVKLSLKSKLPKDQTEKGSFFAYVQQLLTRK